MSDSSSERSQHEQQLDALIAEYYAAAERGRPVDRAEFLRQHPDFSAELREFFADVGQIEQIEQVAPPLHPALEDTRQYDGTQSLCRFFIQNPFRPCWPIGLSHIP